MVLAVKACPRDRSQLRHAEERVAPRRHWGVPLDDDGAVVVPQLPRIVPPQRPRERAPLSLHPQLVAIDPEHDGAHRRGRGPIRPPLRQHRRRVKGLIREAAGGAKGGGRR